MKSSTVRSELDATAGPTTPYADPAELRQLIWEEWRQLGRADLVASLRCHPELLSDRSLLLNLAMDEFDHISQSVKIEDLQQHCHRFVEFGSDIQASIYRQLATQCYIQFLSVPIWPKCGDDFGDFTICEELGAGAASHVYLCRQRDLGDRLVVVKATPYLSIEASILGQLNHPNIVQIYSTGNVDVKNLNYLCMPYCGRSTLTDLLDVAFKEVQPRTSESIISAAWRRMPAQELPEEKHQLHVFAKFRKSSYVDGVLRLAIQIAGALEHAHERHILHGDLKPSNVLLSSSGTPQLLDFNLSHDDTQSHRVCGGTLAYMPPEHLRMVVDGGWEESGDFNAASDIYSFGALLYHLLAGVTPVAMSVGLQDSVMVARTLLSQLEHRIIPLREYNPLVSRRLGALIHRCLALEANQRPATIADVRRELQAETRSWTVLHRMARVRPLLFLAVTGPPLAVFASGAAFFALKPPQHLVEYEQGLQLVAHGKLQQAASHFRAAVASEPEFSEARFQLARSQIALGQLDLALDNFYQLARSESHPHAMAYAGYCFNLKGIPLAAIPWYERAIDSGFTCVEVYNNLGASYLVTWSAADHFERAKKAEKYLLAALSKDQISTAIRLNLVRLAIARSKVDPDWNPFHSWRHAKAVVDNSPEDPIVQLQVKLWYGAVLKWEQTGNRHSALIYSRHDEQQARAFFAELDRTIDPRRKEEAPTTPKLSDNGISAASSIHQYYLEP